MSITCGFIACSPAASEFVSGRTLDDARCAYPSEPVRKEFWHPSFGHFPLGPSTKLSSQPPCSSTPHSLRITQSCSCRQFSDIPRISRHIKLIRTPWGLPRSSFFVKVATMPRLMTCLLRSSGPTHYQYQVRISQNLPRVTRCHEFTEDLEAFDSAYCVVKPAFVEHGDDEL